MPANLTPDRKPALGGRQRYRPARWLVRKRVRNVVPSELAFERHLRRSRPRYRREMYVSAVILFIIGSIGGRWVYYFRNDDHTMWSPCDDDREPLGRLSAPHRCDKNIYIYLAVIDTLLITENCGRWLRRSVQSDNSLVRPTGYHRRKKNHSLGWHSAKTPQSANFSSRLLAE